MGVGIVGGNVVVKYTYQGDVDLNGVVNAADFAQINYGSLNQQNGTIAGRPLAFGDGDVDYNGVINAADFAMTKSASLNQGAALAVSAEQAATESVVQAEWSEVTVLGEPLVVRVSLAKNPFFSAVPIARTSARSILDEATPDQTGILA